ncbi:MAG: tyrosine-protein phosphatase [Terricaulis sp.]
MTPDRLHAFDNVLNFRDFGGYDTPHGKIARGKLYRSANFAEASDADIGKLDALGVRFLVDLRRPMERSTDPNKWPGEKALVFVNDEGVAEVLPPHLVALMQSDLSPGSVRDYMLSIYREFASDPRHIQLYRAWFEELGKGGAGVIHCAAGKDRTGLGCALTLIALGVDEETVFADYVYTNVAMDIDKRLPGIKARMEERLARELDPASLRPMLGVEAAYLRTALDTINERYGSADGYLSDVLGVDDRARETLRSNLLD